MSHTLVFWLVAVVMLVVALVWVLAPLLGRRWSGSSPTRKAAMDEHQQALETLERAMASGEISRAEYNKSRNRIGEMLVQQLTPDEEADKASAVQPRPKLAATIAIAMPALCIGLYLWLGSSDLLQASATQSGADGAPAPGSVEEMVSKLAERLNDNPDDAEGWLMLARSYMVMERYPESAQAYAQAHTLLGDQPMLLVDFAEALTLANDNQMSGLPTTLLGRALAIDPNNQKGLWLAGFAAMQIGDTARGVELWNQLLAQLPPGSDEATTVAGMISEAGGQPAMSATNQVASDTSPAIEVSVTLAPALAAQVSGDETVFIFARAVDGPPMPLAIQRRRASELPFTLTLDDSMAMMPTMKLSSFPVVTVGARISRSGEAVAQSGDLQGLVTPVEAGAQPRVEIEISNIVP